MDKSAANLELTHLLNEHDVARITGLSVATVRRWRLFGQGPRFIKISGSAVRYSPEDLKAYLDTRPTGGGNRVS
jgi:predicted DNA-binding transcriptional regulator AlpA